MRTTVAGMLLVALGGGPVAAQIAPPWIQVSSFSPRAAGVHTMAYDSVRGVMVLLGGDSRTETWEWDGATWALRAATGFPHDGATLAFDSARGVTVAFGGAQRKTWEWDGNVWIDRQIAWPRPDSIGSHAMAFDSSRNVTIVHGGWNGSNELGNTWEWSGSSWASRGGTTPMGAPSIAFDTDRGVCVLFGGQNWVVYRDTLERSGPTWQLRSSEGPSARVNHSMAYDADARVTLLYGGGGNDGNSWEWNGNTGSWRQLGPEGGPAYRRSAPMAYDTRRHRAVLVGGIDCNSQYARGTWERVSIAGWCYPNCDGSSTPPVLNVTDFICYINRYAAGDPYANCDDYCPTLNVADFTCFLNKFAAGCP